DADTTIDDTGGWDLGTQHYQNAGQAKFGTIDVADALKVSSDIFFFQLGAQAVDHDDLIQRWAARFGFGRRTGIDLPGEAAGLVPDATWRTDGYTAYRTCVEKAHLTAGSWAALYRCGGIDKPWTPGDNVNLAVGQGDLQATPLQMATAYSTVINGGKVPRPHVGLEVEDAAGRTLQGIDPGAARHVNISPGNRQAILDGLHLAASAAGGTSADVFRGFPHPVYGKTGTAERPGQEDQSWYVCYVPDGKRPIVVAVTIEQGGFGAEAAAPAARLILSQWFGVKKKLVRGSSRTR
ncbi:MAG: penicillin-binding transpeptidase domain-containing protein, partial [Solirubrobacteraceae bacterium]